MGSALDYGDELVDSWVRRQQWQYKQQAAHLVGLLAKAMSGNLAEEEPVQAQPQRPPWLALAKAGVKLPTNLDR